MVGLRCVRRRDRCVPDHREHGRQFNREYRTMNKHGRSVEQQQIDFWRYVDQPQVGCWNWKRGCSPSGYGTAWFCGKNWRAHRLAWHLAVGEISIGVWVLHTCDNTLCVNPDHLYLGTHKNNSDDKYSRGRARHLHGSNCHLSKLLESQVVEIRQLYPKLTQSKIAAGFGISQATVSRIIRRKTWQHV